MSVPVSLNLNSVMFGVTINTMYFIICTEPLKGYSPHFTHTPPNYSQWDHIIPERQRMPRPKTWNRLGVAAFVINSLFHTQPYRHTVVALSQSKNARPTELGWALTSLSGAKMGTRCATCSFFHILWRINEWSHGAHCLVHLIKNWLVFLCLISH